MPTPTQEEAVGLEKFENADIQANIITRQKELKVGENLDLEIELVNAGKGPALLIKLAEIIPEGFELTEKPEIYRVKDSYLNMKGKRLDPLKTEEVKLILKPKVQGIFPLKPRILYLDENGKYKAHEPEPITINSQKTRNQRPAQRTRKNKITCTRICACFSRKELRVNCNRCSLVSFASFFAFAFFSAHSFSF